MPKCKNCKAPYTKRFPNQIVCSKQCEFEYKKIKAKQAKSRPLTHGKWLVKLQAKINLLIRTIDKGQKCISSDKFTTTPNAGHYWPAGNNGNIRFHLFNIWLQSAQQNKYEEHQPAYISQIKKMYGDAAALWLIDLRKTIGYTKWTIPELEDAYLICLKLIKEAETQPVLNAAGRWEARDHYQERLGLY